MKRALYTNFRTLQGELQFSTVAFPRLDGAKKVLPVRTRGRAGCCHVQSKDDTLMAKGYLRLPASLPSLQPNLPWQSNKICNGRQAGVEGGLLCVLSLFLNISLFLPYVSFM